MTVHQFAVYAMRKLYAEGTVTEGNNVEIAATQMRVAGKRVCAQYPPSGTARTGRKAGKEYGEG